MKEIKNQTEFETARNLWLVNNGYLETEIETSQTEFEVFRAQWLASNGY